MPGKEKYKQEMKEELQRNLLTKIAAEDPEGFEVYSGLIQEFGEEYGDDLEKLRSHLEKKVLGINNDRHDMDKKRIGLYDNTWQKGFEKILSDLDRAYAASSNEREQKELIQKRNIVHKALTAPDSVIDEKRIRKDKNTITFLGFDVKFSDEVQSEIDTLDKKISDDDYVSKRYMKFYSIQSSIVQLEAKDIGKYASDMYLRAKRDYDNLGFFGKLWGRIMPSSISKNAEIYDKMVSYKDVLDEKGIDPDLYGMMEDAQVLSGQAFADWSEQQHQQEHGHFAEETKELVPELENDIIKDEPALNVYQETQDGKFVKVTNEPKIQTEGTVAEMSQDSKGV